MGERVERTTACLGRSFAYTLEVIEHQPGRRIAMRSVSGPFPVTVLYEFEDAEGGTLMRVRVTGEPERLGWLEGPLLNAAVQCSLVRNLRALDDRIVRS